MVGKNALGYIYGGGSGKVTPFHYVDFYNGIASEAKRHGIEVEYVDQLDFMPASSSPIKTQHNRASNRNTTPTCTLKEHHSSKPQRSISATLGAAAQASKVCRTATIP